MWTDLSGENLYAGLNLGVTMLMGQFGMVQERRQAELGGMVRTEVWMDMEDALMPDYRNAQGVQVYKARGEASIHSQNYAP